VLDRLLGLTYAGSKCPGGNKLAICVYCMRDLVVLPWFHWYDYDYVAFNVMLRLFTHWVHSEKLAALEFGCGSYVFP